MTRSKIRKFIAANLIADSNIELKDEDNIFELGFVDSLFALQLVNFIEQEFEFDVPDSDLDIGNFSSINNIARFIERRKKALCRS